MSYTVWKVIEGNSKRIKVKEIQSKGGATRLVNSISKNDPEIKETGWTLTEVFNETEYHNI